MLQSQVITPTIGDDSPQYVLVCILCDELYIVMHVNNYILE